MVNVRPLKPLADLLAVLYIRNNCKSHHSSLRTRKYNLLYGEVWEHILMPPHGALQQLKSRYLVLKKRSFGIKEITRFEPAHEIMAFSSSVNSFFKHGARCLIFGRTLYPLPYFMCANSEGSDETARMRRLAWAFAGCLCDKYHNLMSWLNYEYTSFWVLLLSWS